MMGKLEYNASSHLRQYISELNDLFFSESKVLFCEASGFSFSHSTPVKLHNI
jgi:hypothetical protein